MLLRPAPAAAGFIATLLATLPACTQTPTTARDSAPRASATPAATFKVVTRLDPCIFHIFQDSKGTYWFSNDFGEGSGLYRWDGSSSTFDHFTTASGLPSNGVGKVQEDSSGTLYINTRKGISTFDGHAFTTLKLDESEPARTDAPLGPDVLFFRAGGDQPFLYYHDGQALRKLMIPRTAAGDAFEAKWPRSKYPNRGYGPYDVYTIYKDSRGDVWFGTASLGACRFDGKTFAWISEDELGFAEKDNRTFGTRSIIEDKAGAFWITVTRNSFDMNPSAATPTAAPVVEAPGALRYARLPGLPHRQQDADEDYTYIMSMAKDHAGHLWLVTYGAGVFRHDGTTLRHYPVMADGNPITAFSIYCDHRGTLWLGTHEHSLYKFNGTAFEQAKF